MTPRSNDLFKLLLAPGLAVIVAVAVVIKGPYSYGSGLPTVVIDGREEPEGCLRCHDDIRGLGAAHDPSAIGCSPCHLGDPTALDEHGAHEGMHAVAGNLSIAQRTCGRSGCHGSEVARVQQSVMAGAPALLAVDRFAFGERDAPRVERGDDLRQLDGDAAPKSPAESHVRKLCASCHIGALKTEVGDHGFASRGGGCTACHLNPPAAGPGARREGRLHPDVSAAVREQRCEGCHARSGRIVLSFHGKVELEPDDPRVSDKLADGRSIGTAEPDVHAKAGFTCFDCHTERGIMGGGNWVGHGYEAVDVRCQDCHQPDDEATRVPADASRVAEVLRAAWRRRGGKDIDGQPYRTKSGTPLWRTDRQRGKQWLHATAEAVDVPAAKAEAYHDLKGHERLACQACHTLWAPRCGRCHTRFEPDALQFDHIANRPSPGAWHETAGENSFGLPVLAVGPAQQIGPFVEGMSLRIDGLDKPIERRLWAPLDPHTTGTSRECKTCHRVDDMTSVYPDTGDVTRIGARLLNDEERGRVERVGRCVGCHERYQDVVYEDFATSAQRLRERSDKAVRGCEGRLEP